MLLRDSGLLPVLPDGCTCGRVYPVLFTQDDESITTVKRKRSCDCSNAVTVQGFAFVSGMISFASIISYVFGMNQAFDMVNNGGHYPVPQPGASFIIACGGSWSSSSSHMDSQWQRFCILSVPYCNVSDSLLLKERQSIFKTWWGVNRICNTVSLQRYAHEEAKEALGMNAWMLGNWCCSSLAYCSWTTIICFEQNRKVQNKTQGIIVHY